MKLTAINIYPIKSTAAIPLQSAEVRPRGLAGDRRWVICDAEGQFLHQRLHPRLALVQTQVRSDAELQIDAPGCESLLVQVPASGPRAPVTVWQDDVEAADAGEPAARWFSSYLEFPARLRFMDSIATRPVPAPYGHPSDVVSFADAAPLLLATEASLEDLNQRLEQPVPMSRFRPNLVIDGEVAWQEESWKQVHVGGIPFEVTHACVRCVMTTIDQRSGEKQGPEPLKTLATFRHSPEGVCFGVNLIPRGNGSVRVGDDVEGV